LLALCGALMLTAASPATAARGKAQAFLPSPVLTVSTVPANGDVNPYGVAFVPAEFPTGGALAPGDILVSNFNNAENLQGTGTTIVRIRNGAPSLFFQGQPPQGLSTALKGLKAGYVLVGNFPSADGTCQTAQDGSILVINSSGVLLGSIINNQMIVGPWLGCSPPRPWKLGSIFHRERAERDHLTPEFERRLEWGEGGERHHHCLGLPVSVRPGGFCGCPHGVGLQPRHRYAVCRFDVG
jgi:hypothetical protein